MMQWVFLGAFVISATLSGYFGGLAMWSLNCFSFGVGAWFALWKITQ